MNPFTFRQPVGNCAPLGRPAQKERAVLAVHTRPLFLTVSMAPVVGRPQHIHRTAVALPGIIEFIAVLPKEILSPATPETIRAILADHPRNESRFPSQFLREAGNTLGRTQENHKTGLVPVVPSSPSTAIETLVEEMNCDKNRSTPQPQLHFARCSNSSRRRSAAHCVRNWKHSCSRFRSDDFGRQQMIEYVPPDERVDRQDGSALTKQLEPVPSVSVPSPSRQFAAVLKAITVSLAG